MIADIQMDHDFPTERRAFFESDVNPGGTILIHKEPDNIWRIDYQLKDDEDDREAIQEANIRSRVAAILEMIGEFSAGRLQKKNEANSKHYKTLIDTPPVQNEVFTLYKFALRTLYEVLKQDFSLIQSIPLARSSDFLESVNRENDIEGDANAFG